MSTRNKHIKENNNNFIKYNQVNLNNNNNNKCRKDIRVKKKNYKSLKKKIILVKNKNLINNKFKRILIKKNLINNKFKRILIKKFTVCKKYKIKSNISIKKFKYKLFKKNYFENFSSFPNKSNKNFRYKNKKFFFLSFFPSHLEINYKTFSIICLENIDIKKSFKFNLNLPAIVNYYSYK